MTTAHTISTERLVSALQGIALKQQRGRLSGKHQGRFGLHSPDTKQLLPIEFEETRNTPSFEIPIIPTDRNLSNEAMTPITIEETHYLPSIQLEETHYLPSFEIPIISTGSDQPYKPLLPIELEDTRHTPSIGIPIISKSVNPAADAPIMPPILPSPSNLPLPQEVIETRKLPHLGVHTIFRALPIATSPKVLHLMERRDRVVLMLLDGKRTICNIAYLIHRNELDIARTLVRLLKQGYIEYSKT